MGYTEMRTIKYMTCLIIFFLVTAFMAGCGVEKPTMVVKAEGNQISPMQTVTPLTEKKKR